MIWPEGPHSDGDEGVPASAGDEAEKARRAAARKSRTTSGRRSKCVLNCCGGRLCDVFSRKFRATRRSSNRAR